MTCVQNVELTRGKDRQDLKLNTEKLNPCVICIAMVDLTTLTCAMFFAFHPNKSI